MYDASIVLPTRDRAAKLIRSVHNIRDTVGGFNIEIIVVVDEPDTTSQSRAHDLGVDQIIIMPSRYVVGNSMRKWQAGYEAANAEWVVQSADDIMYNDGWLDAALNHKDPGIKIQGFIGLWDVEHGRRRASLRMAAKTYIETYDNGHFGLPWYYANWADNEWTCTARGRKALTFCPQASYTHLHYTKTGEPMDEIARAAHNRHSLDQATFFARRDAGWPETWPQVW